jgi:hypothetical protein
MCFGMGPQGCEDREELGGYVVHASYVHLILNIMQYVWKAFNNKLVSCGFLATHMLVKAPPLVAKHLLEAVAGTAPTMDQCSGCCQ